jgi:hypothetical protein
MNPEKIGKQVIKRILMEEEMTKVSIYPGAFKPPHKGHVETALRSIDDKTNKAIIFMSTKEREDVDVEEAKQVWDLYKANIPELEKVEIHLTPTPVKAVYDYAKDNPTHDIRAVFGKGEEERFKSLLDKEKYPHVEVFDAGTVGDFSATILRQAIRDKDLETIRDYIPYLINVDDFLNIFEMNEGLYPRYDYRKVKQVRYKASDVHTNDPDKLEEDDPKKGTGKKPKGSGRRLYTDEDPTDTVKVKFSTRQDIVDTLGKTSFKNKSHARQSQVINLIHQRVRAALGRTKDPLKKAKLKSAFEYIKKRKEASKKKTQRLKNKKENIKEIGDSTATPYPYKKVFSSRFETTYDFTTDKDTEYRLIIDTKVANLPEIVLTVYKEAEDEEGVKAGGFTSKAVTNKGELFRVMSTTFDIIDEWLNENPDITRFTYDPISKVNLPPDEESKRGKLYQKYIKQRFPNSKIIKDVGGGVVVNLKEEDKYLQEARYKKFLNEAYDDSKAKIIDRFMDYATDYLSIDRPKIKLINQDGYTQQHRSFGGYSPSDKKVMVVVYNRNMADILRTLAHELVHHMQNLDNRLNPKSGEDGSPEENEANSLAAVMMRKFGRENPDIYE